MSGYLLVCLGAAVGAPARYLLDRLIQSRHDSLMPWGTLTVNVVGSLALGVVMGLAERREISAEVALALGTGLCGAFTTYSTFSFETVRLFASGARLGAVVNATLALVAGFAAAVVGYTAGSAG